MIGRTVGRYRIVAKLGEGGMGSVWKAEDALLGRSVALKFLTSEMANSPAARARFLHEAQAASKLDHPGIGTIYDVGDQDGAVYIALRLVDGDTIHDRIRLHGPFPLRAAVDITLAAADALAHAHARGILHRDISSRNLMLTRDGQVVVVDFGLALAEGASRMTQSGVTMGTVAYMAPEVVQGQPADRRSEVYALGAVLYEMLTGRVPFQADRTAAMLYAIVHEEPAPPTRVRPEIPLELERLVVQALAKDPQERPADMPAFLDALEELRDGVPAMPAAVEGQVLVAPVRRTPLVESSEAETIAPTETLEPAAAGEAVTASRRRRLWIAVAGGLVVLGATTVLLLWSARRGQEGPSATTATTYHSVAVLPLRNLSANAAASEHLAEGITQALNTKLTQMSGLRVTPWMTARRYRDPDTTIERLVQQLRVDALLVGTFQQSGERIGGTVSLVDGKTGFQVWAEEFNEPLADLFAVQNRIAMGAATRLLGKLTGQQVDLLATPVAQNPDAYQSYLKGMAALQKGDPVSSEETLQLFQRAVELDPGLAEAHVGLGSVLVNRYFYGWGGTKILDKAEAHFNKALELDPGMVGARRGLIHLFWERGKSEECLKQGKLLAASGIAGVEVLLARAAAYFFGGLEHRALPLLGQVIEEDPGNAGAYWLLTIAAAWSGNHAKAIEAGESYLRLFGEDAEVHLWIAVSHQRLGEMEKARQHYERMVETMPQGVVRYHLLYAAAFFRRTGDLDRADRLLLDGLEVIEHNLERSPDNPKVRADLANYYGLLGDLSRAEEEEVRLLHDYLTNPQVFMELHEGVVLRGDGRYSIDLVRRSIQSGFVWHAWRETLALSGIETPSSLPGYRELLAEYEAAVKRLESLY